MNIYAKNGDKVVFTGEGGCDSDNNFARLHLEIGKEYEVERTEVGGWHTNVYLKGFGLSPFNSVMFEDA